MCNYGDPIHISWFERKNQMVLKHLKPKIKLTSSEQRMSNSPKQLDFALGLGDFILYLPDGQITVVGEFFGIM